MKLQNNADEFYAKLPFVFRIFSIIVPVNLTMIREKSKPADNPSGLISDGKELILFNDDVNSFDFVIETLIEVCDHEMEQAEQCALIAHYKGKCVVKSGSFEELKPKSEEMSRRGLTVEIL
jgi:ATP-dependent Clp protease adaptor protein ClpS